MSISPRATPAHYHRPARPALIALRGGLVAAALAGAACHAGAGQSSVHAAATVAPRVANLHAFARLYGLGRMWLRVDRDAQRGFFGNMRERPRLARPGRPPRSSTRS
jgi:hypothetical protein